MLIRMLISRRRITRGSIAGIWREIRDLWIDHGLAWPDGTPRRQAAALVTDMDPDTSAAVKKLALAEEMDRCLLYTSPSPRDRTRSRMPSSA